VTTALFPGSFDPFHMGHLEVVERALGVFDEVVVAVLRNPGKSEPLFTAAEREEMILECFDPNARLRVTSMSSLVVEVAKQVGADVIVKGLRAATDFENELQMAQMNRELSGIDTIFIPTSSSYSFIASRLIREIARLGGDVSPFIPEPVMRKMKEKFA
jgi:pantetheine-phosphate adenylyltransferase